MGKHDFLTPKAIANRIKSKGLQKLRWYCQMCQKQCRDENGFKCHTMSESHQRQLLLFAEDPEQYLDAYSDEYLSDFIELLRRRFGTRRVHSNVVYNEYIQDKEHIHMNSTKWETLTEFVKWLGREGYATVDQTEKGWFITYIDRDPETISRQEALAKKQKMQLDDEEKIQKFIQKQIEKVKEKSSQKEENVFTELQREDAEEKIRFSLGGKAPSTSTGDGECSEEASSSKTVIEKKPAVKPKIVPTVNPLKIAGMKKKESSSSKDRKRKSALDEIMQEESMKKAKVKRYDNWLTEGIVVKVITKKLGEKYFKKKAVILEVRDKYTAVVKMNDSGKCIKVLNGEHRGSKAVLLALNQKSFSVTIKLEDPTKAGLLKAYSMKISVKQLTNKQKYIPTVISPTTLPMLLHVLVL
ncbi:DNA/RNA-binding protein KIN17-like isoform X2 [Saccoglossus kowalevskii]